MANFPIQTTQRSLPGRGVASLGDVDVRTGGQQVAQAFAQLGGSLIDVGVTEWKLDADTQLTDAVAKDQEALNGLANRLEANTDAHTYQEEYEKVLGEIQGREIKNGLAARKHSRWVTQNMPTWQQGITEAKRARINDNWKSALFEAKQKAIKTGTLARYRGLLNSGLRAGRISDSEAAQELFDTQHKAEVEAALSLAFANPQAAMDGIDADEFVTLNTNDKLRIRNVANTRQKDFQIKESEQTNKLRTEITDVAWPAAANNDISSAQNAILGAPEELGAKWKDAELVKLKQAAEMITTQGINPYTQRTDQSAYETAVERAIEQNLTVTEINAGVGDKWTIADGQKLREIIQGQTDKSRDQEQLQAIRDVASIVRTADPLNVTRSGIRAAQSKAVTLMEDFIKANPDVTDKDLKIQALKIGREMRRIAEKGLTGEQILPIPADVGLPGTIVRIDGQAVGTVDSEGALVLNRNGLERVKRITGGDKVRARRFIKDRGFKIGSL